jgi:SET domain-containing protein
MNATVQVNKHEVQIIHNYAIHYYAEKHYPNLYKEVMAHDKTNNSSWYSLSDAAYEEWKRYKKNRLRWKKSWRNFD